MAECHTEEKEESKPEEPKIWMPCESSDRILERHDFENRHGDICRMKNNSYKCPVDCRDTGGNAPFCANKDGGPCRVKDPSEPKEFRCDFIKVLAPLGSLLLTCRAAGMYLIMLLVFILYVKASDLVDYAQHKKETHQKTNIQLTILSYPSFRLQITYLLIYSFNTILYISTY